MQPGKTVEIVDSVKDESGNTNLIVKIEDKGQETIKLLGTEDTKTTLAGNSEEEGRNPFTVLFAYFSTFVHHFIS
ncbi:MAG: hypothetical protein HQK84_10615 [Nitrospinae bacterium]|nr:hypothetical protein [Nitrospinota bacterium]